MSGSPSELGRELEPERPLSSDSPEGELLQPTGNDDVVGLAFRWSLVGLAALVVVAFFAWLLFAPVDAGDAGARTGSASPELTDPKLTDVVFPDVPFTEITRQAGIDFVHFNGVTGKLMMPENIGSGCAFFDFDNDGDQDILLINGTYFPGHEPPAGKRPTLALYENDGKGHFRDVTAGSGLEVSLYGMGVAVGDYDGDGRTDIFVTALGGNHLFRNLGGGKFVDVTDKAGVRGDPHRWSTSAGFVDYNNDGYLDLFVCNYVDWSEELDDKLDHHRMGVRDYLPPWFFRGTHSYLYRNRGDGTFLDVSREAGIQVTNPANGVPKGKAFGVTFCDLDDDGWMDIIVANDTVQTFLFHNQRNGTFKEIGESAGLGTGRTGLPVAGMGLDAARLHEDPRMTVGVSTIAGETTALFLSQDNPLSYTDAVLSMGIAAETFPYTKWGLFFFDYDLDGRLDMFQCNGEVECEECCRIVKSDYLQPSQLFWNCGPGQPARLAALPLERRAPVMERRLLARGAAYADIDGDGDLDILITQNGRPPLLLRNDQRLGHHWIRLKLEGDGHNRDAIGAKVDVRIGDQWLRRVVMPTRSYCSQVELPVTIGLGHHLRPDEVRVTWPDGARQTVNDVAVDRSMTVKKAP